MACVDQAEEVGNDTLCELLLYRIALEAKDQT
jgi:hypothetical protein